MKFTKEYFKNEFDLEKYAVYCLAVYVLGIVTMAVTAALIWFPIILVHIGLFFAVIASLGFIAYQIAEKYRG